jgi:hypothetical protein
MLLGKGEIDTRLEAENEKVYSKARDKVDLMVSEAEVVETASLEEVSSSSKQKPRVSLVDQEGNVFNLLSVCVTALKQAGQKAEAEELSKRAFTCGSFDNAVSLMMEYVEEESLSPASPPNAAISARSRAKQAMEAREVESQAQRAEEVVAKLASTPRGVESSLPYFVDKARAEVRDMRAAAEKETATASLTPLSEERTAKQVNEGAKETKETRADVHARGARISAEKIIEIHEPKMRANSTLHQKVPG